MFQRKTVVDQIEITRSGAIQVRFGLLLVEDGIEIDCKWHRTAIAPGGDVDAQISAVNAHLVQMGKEPAGSADIDRVKVLAAAAWTPEVLEAAARARSYISASIMERPLPT